MPEKTSKKRVRILTHLPRHKRLELMRPMLAQFPHSCLFGICKAASLASPCKNSCTKIFRCIGSASSKRANFLQEKAKAELIVYLLTSILTHYCGKFAFLNRMGFESLMPMHIQKQSAAARNILHQTDCKARSA